MAVERHQSAEPPQALQIDPRPHQRAVHAYKSWLRVQHGLMTSAQQASQFGEARVAVSRSSPTAALWPEAWQPKAAAPRMGGSNCLGCSRCYVQTSQSRGHCSTQKA